MDLPSSGLSNEGLETSINDFIDRMIELKEDETIWDYFPSLLPISVALVVHELFKRHKKGEITKINLVHIFKSKIQHLSA